MRRPHREENPTARARDVARSLELWKSLEDVNQGSETQAKQLTFGGWMSR